MTKNSFVAEVTFNPLSTKDVYIRPIEMQGSNQGRIYIQKTRNLETIKSMKIYILTTRGIYIHPLCNLRGHQIKIGNIS